VIPMQLSASLWHSLCVGQVPHTAASSPCSSVVGWEAASLTPCRLGVSPMSGGCLLSLHTSACSPGSRTPSTRLGVSLWHSLLCRAGPYGCLQPRSNGSPEAQRAEARGLLLSWR
jgi:hypothetical protein